MNDQQQTDRIKEAARRLAESLGPISEKAKDELRPLLRSVNSK